MLRILFVLFALVICGKAEAETNYLRCDTCSTYQDYSNRAKQWGQSQAAGYYDVFVLNNATNQIYMGDVYVELEPHNMKIVSAGLSPAPAEAKEFLIDFKAYVAEAGEQLVVVMPPSTFGIGGENFKNSNPETIGLALNQDPLYAEFVKENFYSDGNLAKIVWDGLVMLVTQAYPQMVAIFENGDVAIYDVKDPRGGAVCCQYVEGTARDKNGNFIGSGSPSGGSYVGPLPGGGFKVTWHEVIVSCGRVGSGPWHCEIVSEDE